MPSVDSPAAFPDGKLLFLLVHATCALHAAVSIPLFFDMSVEPEAQDKRRVEALFEVS